VVRVVSRFGVLRQLQQILRYVPPSTFQTHVVALVLTQLDYANNVLVGLPVHLQFHVFNGPQRAARLIYGLRRCDRITDALLTLHWLKVSERIQFRLVVLTHRVLHGTAPSCLGPLLR
jgi:hypothetical protein